jgi:hypothetical protein
MSQVKPTKRQATPALGGMLNRATRVVAVVFDRLRTLALSMDISSMSSC